jgi:hypothetical protein
MPGQVEDIIKAADAELGKTHAAPFSKAAFATLREKVSIYVGELISESVQISRRHRADTVSAAHVEQATSYLVANSSQKLYRHLGTIGGILLGASIGNILAMVTANSYTTPSVVITLALGILGAFLVAIHIAKD